MRSIRQETFDEAVRENREEFGMSEEDAIRSAVSEFEAQGVDLRDVIKSKTDARENSPALITWRTLRESLRGSDDPDRCVSLLVRLKQQVQESDPRAETILLLSHEGAMDVVMERMHVDTKDQGFFDALLDVVLVLLQEQKNKEKFHAMDGPTRSLALWRGRLEDQESIGRIMRMISAASSKHEKNKCAFMELGIANALTAAFAQRPCSLQLVRASCHVICAMTCADDPEATVSECFKFARDLVTCNVHASLIACMRVEWQALGYKDRQLLLSALRHLCVNEEICRSVSEEHEALSLVMSAVTTGMRDVDLVSAAVALLRQLAGSDSVKMLMQENNIFWLLQVVLDTHGANPRAAEYTAGLLGALYLRNLNVLALSVAEEMMERILEIMKVQEGNGNVQRSCCMALRNMAARNASIRNACLQKGAVMLVQSAVFKHPSLCADVGSAALRDFGLDDYMSSHKNGMT